MKEFKPYCDTVALIVGVVLCFFIGTVLGLMALEC